MKTNIDLKHILQRQAIDNQLADILKVPLTVVTAPMGYGKTTAVTTFLAEEKHVSVIFLSASRFMGSGESFWNALIDQLLEMKAISREHLSSLRFPSDEPSLIRLVNFMQTYIALRSREKDIKPFIIVIDDYHLLANPQMDAGANAITRANLPHFHLVLISRTLPEVNMLEFQIKGLVKHISTDDFLFTPCDIKQLFESNGISIEQNIADHIYKKTGGWISAIYLIMREYAGTGELNPAKHINELMNSAFYKNYTEDIKEKLCFLAILGHVKREHLIDFIGKSAFNRLSAAIANNAFITYEDPTATYHVHDVYAQFLIENRLIADFGSEKAEYYYKKAGELFHKQGSFTAAVKAYYNASDYERILTLMEECKAIKLLFESAVVLDRLFEGLPEELKLKFPIAYAKYIFSIIMYRDPAWGARLLNEAEDLYLTKFTEDKAKLNSILGEIYFLKIQTSFNNLEKMFEYCRMALACIPEGSKLATNLANITYGSPHFTHLFHITPGKYRDLAYKSTNDLLLYPLLTGGTGTGDEHLFIAEYCLETGDFEQAEIEAYKAVYKAMTKNQVAIIICAKFTLARIMLFQGNIEKAYEILDEISHDAENHKDPLCLNAAEQAHGYIYACLNMPEKIPAWLRTGDLPPGRLAYRYSFGFNYLIGAKYLNLSEEYFKLEAFSEHLKRLYSRFNNQLCLIHTFIFEALAKMKTKGINDAINSLLKAMDIAYADNILAPVAEYGIHVLPIINAIEKEKLFNERYIKRLGKLCKRYAANVNTVFNGEVRTQSLLADLSIREMEVLTLIAEGKTNRDIAKHLYVAEITVKKTVANIYYKLGVKNRSEAIQFYQRIAK